MRPRGTATGTASSSSSMMAGTIELRRPQVRGLEQRFESRILPLFVRRTEQVGELLPQLYLHGLAQGDFELALRGLLGDGAPLSPSSIGAAAQQVAAGVRGLAQPAVGQFLRWYTPGPTCVWRIATCCQAQQFAHTQRSAQKHTAKPEAAGLTGRAVKISRTGRRRTAALATRARPRISIFGSMSLCGVSTGTL